jgi:heme/copper-type cytochrome/quinol oxidase subunit 2
MKPDPNARPAVGSTSRGFAIAFFALAVVLFLAVDLAADVVARVSVRGQAPDVAAREHLRLVGLQIVGTAILALPFIGLAFIGLPVMHNRGGVAGVVFLVGGALLLGVAYGLGYQQVAHAMSERHWTAAALSQAFILVMCLPALLVAFVVARFVGNGRGT